MARLLEGGLPGFVLRHHQDGFTGLSTVTASLEDEDEAEMLQGHDVSYYWGRVSGNGSIVWTESTVLTYQFHLLPGRQATVYFKVQMDGYEWIYSIRCHSFGPLPDLPFGLIEVTPDGELLAEGEDGEDVTIMVKSETGPSRTQYEYSFPMIGEYSADHILSSAEMCQLLLENTIFAGKLKELRPWGEDNLLVIPYSVNCIEQDVSIDSMLQFVYNEMP